MYQIGDYIVKSGNGVCRIEKVMHLDMAGIDRNRLYYMLVPINDENGKVYVPVDTSVRQLRKVMSTEEAYALIAKISDAEEIDVQNDKLREQKYKEILKEFEPESMLRIMKTTYLRRKERLEQGKKNMAVDEYYLNLTEKIILSELCLVLNKDQGEIRDLFMKTIENA
ncbi:MAG: CarD family transcriptional regulator [Lachnospiraceae bacterium]|nr:CarD family transcriptional regulator [Lachnospiraceae bacterium]